jgi:hypothetical protein
MGIGRSFVEKGGSFAPLAGGVVVQGLALDRSAEVKWVALVEVCVPLTLVE